MREGGGPTVGSLTGVGPDLVVAGAARSGTSFLAAALSGHPGVDPCAVKEPNFFSREWHRPTGWYDQLFSPRGDGRLRLDASMSYTFGHFPDALGRLAETSPNVFVVYAVRHPVRRMLSHFQLHRDYFRNEPSRTLGAALDRTTLFRDASDYARWLGELSRYFPPERLLVLPFPALTQRRDEVADVLADATGLDREGFDAPAAEAERHRNEVVEFRAPGLLHLRRAVRRSGLYPALRRTVGADRLRRVRERATRAATTESLSEALSGLDDHHHALLRDLYDSASAAVVEALTEQDRRLGLGWVDLWSDECPQPGVSGRDW